MAEVEVMKCDVYAAEMFDATGNTFRVEYEKDNDLVRLSWPSVEDSPIWEFDFSQAKEPVSLI